MNNPTPTEQAQPPEVAPEPVAEPTLVLYAPPELVDSITPEGEDSIHISPQPGDVVQITPDMGNQFAGCYFVVTEVHEWGCKGYVPVPLTGLKNPKDAPEPGLAILNIPYGGMVFVGRATYFIADWEPVEAPIIQVPDRKIILARA